ncbi:hypothetical protein ABT214_16510 [Micromonospora purpureochromogenes]|uniref:hypothetical protein n=1 Tax=Micromonospora purpureochromogenes TaxID=47872 RepID=UPI0033321796
MALNVTAVAPAAGGYVTVWPADQLRPMASNLNIETAGQVIPNWSSSRFPGPSG